jgi:hypothetical protein
MKPDPEQTLRTLRWRDPPPEFLARVLANAHRERECAASRKSWLSFIPRPLRLPLAACWLLALYFRLTTPEAIPQATLQNYAKLPPVTPAQLLAHLAEAERLAHELLEQRRGPIPPL